MVHSYKVRRVFFTLLMHRVKVPNVFKVPWELLTHLPLKNGNLDKFNVYQEVNVELIPSSC